MAAAGCVRAGGRQRRRAALHLPGVGGSLRARRGPTTPPAPRPLPARPLRSYGKTIASDLFFNMNMSVSALTDVLVGCASIGEFLFR